MNVFDDLDAFSAAQGRQLGFSEWHTVTQGQIDEFASATLDRQWIHLDPKRASTGPFGGTIAHGFLTLSLLPALLDEIYAINNVAMSLNYGLDRVRFPAPVPVDSRLRGSARLDTLTPTGRGLLASLSVTIEVHGAHKPCCVAQMLSLFVPA